MLLSCVLTALGSNTVQAAVTTGPRGAKTRRGELRATKLAPAPAHPTLATVSGSVSVLPVLAIAMREAVIQPVGAYPASSA